MGDLYIIGIDHGDPNGDYSCKTVVKVNDDGSLTVIKITLDKGNSDAC